MPILQKIVFAQNIEYSFNEDRLSFYHGAIFADWFRSIGVDATKMVIGDEHHYVPKSSLLSLSTLKQRLDSKYWKQKAFDIIVYYGGENIRNIPILKAIKTGSPKSVLILKMDAAYGPIPSTFTNIFRAAKIAYIKDRHGHSGSKGHTSSLPPLALTKAVMRIVRMLSPSYINDVSRLFQIPDFISYESNSALVEAKDWLNFNGLQELQSKVVWLGYPVRNIFADFNDNMRKPNSIISIANWKHAKDLHLHARALAKVFKDDLSANFTLIGENSALLQKLILELSPNSASRISRIDELSNTELPRYLHNSQVFMLCSFTEGYCSAVVEALCSGCSVALTTGLGVPCFKGFSNNECGTQAKSRSPDDMADAVSYELNAWRKGMRNPIQIKKIWQKTLVSNLCRHLCDITGFSLPDF